MNKKVYFLAAIAAVSFASCSNNDGAESIDNAKTQAQVSQQAIGFDAYNNRGLTRAVTEITTLQTNGFGIFAYYTGNDDYDGQQLPNFMWNQQVTFDDPNWKYEPVKYWPNEYGDAAVADETDRISFFAYGPYAAATSPSTGKVNDTKNIIGFTRNNYVGDPMVKYVVDFNPSSSVDLVWGRQPAGNTFKAYDLTTYSAEGLPWLNIKRPQYANNATEKVKFQFDHALASLNVTVDHYADVADYAASKPVTGDTRIWIRSITFTGFASQGALNLNNNETATNSTGTVGKALWMGINGDELATGEDLVINDGRKDGKEGTAVASNEKFVFLNDALVQSDPYIDYAPATKLKISDDVTGVTDAAKNIFKGASDAADPIYVLFLT